MTFKNPFNGTSKITTLFGKKGSWQCGWHIGIDIVGLSNKYIHPIESGKVIKITSSGSYGKCVRVQHSNGYLSLYAHMSRVNVQVGQSVTHNTILGVEGSTGNSSGSHLHLEIHKGGYKYPPKNSSPATCSWLLDPCTVLGIEKKLGKVNIIQKKVEEEMAQIKKVKIVLPNGAEKQYDGIEQNGTNYVGIRSVLESLGFVVTWKNNKIYITKK